MSQNREPVEIEDVRCDQETDSALHCTVVTTKGVRAFWVPKSQLLEDNAVMHRGDQGTLIIPQWLAEDRELV